MTAQIGNSTVSLPELSQLITVSSFDCSSDAYEHHSSVFVVAERRIGENRRLPLTNAVDVSNGVR